MSNQKVPKDKDGGRKHFSVKEYKLLCEWLEIDGNLDSILSSEGKTKVWSRYHTKKLAFENMAQYINDRQCKGSNLAKVDFQGAKNRFNHLNAKYKRAKQMSEGTGFGVTEADEADGIYSMEAKLKKLCPCFERLDSIFGRTPKVDTAGNLYVSSLLDQADGTIPEDFLTQHDSTRCSPSVQQHDLPDFVDSGDVESTPKSPEAAVPITPMESFSHAELNGRPIQTPPLQGQTPICEDSSPQSEDAARPQSSAKSKHKFRQGSANHKKKHSTEKHTGFTGTFAQSIEMLNEGKLRSLEMKEKVMKQRAAAATIRAEMAQQQLGLQQQRLRLEEKKFERDAASKEAEFAEAKRARKVQARIDVIKANIHRPPHELAEIIAMVENVD